jgi:putative endonuclease
MSHHNLPGSGKMSEILSVLKQDKRQRLHATSEIGERGERLAARFLETNGYRLVLSNFKVPIGRNSRGVSVTGEIDIIALDGETLCFVEVKTRTSSEFADPIANVNKRKQRQIIRAARIYKRVFGVTDVPHRFDVVSVIVERPSPLVELTKDFWSEASFRKRAWSGDIY